MLTFTCHGKNTETVTAGFDTLVIAGWTGRDIAALEHHIEELAALGVPRPSSVPVFYRTSVNGLTQTRRLEVLGPHTSGEVEPVLLGLDSDLWLGLGSDHTDRKAETPWGLLCRSSSAARWSGRRFGHSQRSRVTGTVS
ncbi:MAG: DUF2848 family protein [Bradyrhizobium sp.]